MFFVTPIFRNGRIVAYAMNVSHSPDVGGRLLSADSKEIFEEGFRLPVIKLYQAGQPNEDLFRIIRMNVRVPDIVIGDLEAQLAANTITARRVEEFMDANKLECLDELFEEIWKRSDLAMAEAISAIPDGTYRGEVLVVEDDPDGQELFSITTICRFPPAEVTFNRSAPAHLKYRH